VQVGHTTERRFVFLHCGNGVSGPDGFFWDVHKDIYFGTYGGKAFNCCPVNGCGSKSCCNEGFPVNARNLQDLRAQQMHVLYIVALTDAICNPLPSPRRIALNHLAGRLLGRDGVHFFRKASANRPYPVTKVPVFDIVNMLTKAL